MDEFDHPFGEALGPFSILTYVIAFVLCLTTSLLSFSEMSQVGPDVGEMIIFDPRDGPKHWDQPGIQAGVVGFPNRGCLLVPSVIAGAGGSFVIEAKQMSHPPIFLVHWSGRRTEQGTQDCGRSADLTLSLTQLRALANVAGGFGLVHGLFSR